MALLEVLTHPDPRLRAIAEPVTEWTESLKVLVENMFETMYDQQGVGLAATQVGVLLRVIVVDCGGDTPNPMVLVNPEISAHAGETSFAEGCLSVPGLRAEIDRTESIEVRHQDVDGKTRKLEASGLLSICIQHEIDHLNGVLYFDHLKEFERKAFLQAYEDAHGIGPS